MSETVLATDKRPREEAKDDDADASHGGVKRVNSGSENADISRPAFVGRASGTPNDAAKTKLTVAVSCDQGTKNYMEDVPVVQLDAGGDSSSSVRWVPCSGSHVVTLRRLTPSVWRAASLSLFYFTSPSVKRLKEGTELNTHLCVGEMAMHAGCHSWVYLTDMAARWG